MFDRAPRAPETFSRAVGTPLTSGTSRRPNPMVTMATRVPDPPSSSGPDQAMYFRKQLEELIPSVTLSVEMPFPGNGNLYQVRTTVSDLIFYGRASTEDEAVVKCCKKAVAHIQQHWDRNNNAPREMDREHHHHQRPSSSSSGSGNHGTRPKRNHPRGPPPPSLSSSSSNYRGSRAGGHRDETMSGRRYSSELDERRMRRERELRTEMGGVMAMLDRRCGVREVPEPMDRYPVSVIYLLLGLKKGNL